VAIARRKRRRLKNLRIAEVSLVGRPANMTEFLFTKALDIDGDELVEVDEGALVSEALDEAVAELDLDEGDEVSVDADGVAADVAEVMDKLKEDDDVSTDLQKDALPILLPILGKFFDERGRTCSQEQFADFIQQLARQSGDQSETALEALSEACSREVAGWNAYQGETRRWTILGVTG